MICMSEKYLKKVIERCTQYGFSKLIKYRYREKNLHSLQRDSIGFARETSVVNCPTKCNTFPFNPIGKTNEWPAAKNAKISRRQVLTMYHGECMRIYE